MTCPVPVAYTRKPTTNRKALMLSCAAAAMAAGVVNPQKAGAQAFQGTPTTASGSVSYDRFTNQTPTPGLENITISSPQAVIDWVPSDTTIGGGAIGFQYDGTTVNFNAGTGLTDFAVLNRINPADTTRIISLDGTINSFVGQATGGKVYFYSPSGFVLGHKSVINVGSLLLTALPVSVDANGNFIANGTITLGQAPNPTAKIVTAGMFNGNQATVNALQEGSYVAMVAPRVEHNGSVRVNGSAAYVAAEQATMTINQGLFNIQVSVGTTDADGIVHTGTTTGPSSTGTTDYHRIYMVAVPKNQALSMLLNGSIGFEATTASYQNGQIVLAGGHSIDESTGNRYASRVAGSNGGITIGGAGGAATFTSDVWGIARGPINAVASTGNLAFAGRLHLVNENGINSGNVSVGAENGHQLNVTGDLGLYSISAPAPTTVELFARSGGTVNVGSYVKLSTLLAGTPGTVSVRADNGAVTFGSWADLDASVGKYPPGNAASEDAKGGTVELLASNGGSIQTRALNLYAYGNGQDNAGQADGIAGDGTGGQINMQADSGGSIQVNGALVANATGSGGDMTGANSVSGGRGEGGDISIHAGDGTISILGTMTLSAVGDGGSYLGESTSDSAVGGEGQGGDVSVSVDGPGSISVTGISTLSAGGSGGGVYSDGLGGAGRGGTVNLGINGTGGAATFGGRVELSADGQGGQSGAPGSTSASGFGGTVNVFSSGDLQFDSHLWTYAQGVGGESEIVGNWAGYGEGGAINISANSGGTLDIAGSLEAWVEGDGGYTYYSGVNDGDGKGGSVNLHANGGNAVIHIAGNTDLVADGDASSAGGCLSCGGIAGNGTGGNINVGGSGGTGNRITMDGYLYASASGYGGVGVTGAAGNGTGGNVYLTAQTGGALTVGDGAHLYALGIGGYDIGGFGGGDGTGGVAHIQAAGGAVDVTGSAGLDAGGYGGNTGEGGEADGGDGRGGSARLQITGGTFEINGSAFVYADGQGGNASGGTGGDGKGGDALINAFGGTMTITSTVRLSALSKGGGGEIGGAGAGYGQLPADLAEARIFANGGIIDIDGITTVDASATGGSGSDGNGGLAEGGLAEIVARSGEIRLVNAYAAADATGGDGGGGGDGGDAYAGQVYVSSTGAAAALISANRVEGYADGRGGAGGAGLAGNSGTAGGAGGDGYGGRVNITGSAAGGVLDVVTANAYVRGFGGAGGDGGSGDGGSGGAGGAGGAGYGGGSQMGTISTTSFTATGGRANYGNALIDTSAVGGAGGNGGTGGGGTGAGGNGGAASGGGSSFLARGVLVEADTVQLESNATGGAGGAGSVQGNGGDATTGALSVESKDRFENSTQRGTLNVGSIVGNAIAVGGSGAVAGVSYTGEVDSDPADGFIPGGYFRVLNGDAHIGSLEFNIAADEVVAGSVPFFISVIDGDAIIDGSFSVTTTGNLLLTGNDEGFFSAGSLFLTAGNFVADPSPDGNATYEAETIDIKSDLDFTTNANLAAVLGIESGGDLTITAQGSITTNDLSADTLATLTAVNGDITTGDITTLGSVFLNAGDTVDTGDVLAEGDINVDAATYDAEGSVISGTNVSLDANITSGTDLTIHADGDLYGSSFNVAGTLTLEGVESVSVDSIFASVASLVTEGTASIYSIVSAGTINVTSGDIFIGEVGSLGIAGVTEVINLTAVTDEAILIGSGGIGIDGPQYVLNEDGNIAASTLNIIAQSASGGVDPDVLIYDVEIDSTGVEGAQLGQINVATDGDIAVEGVVQWFNAAESDGLNLVAGGNITSVDMTLGANLAMTAGLAIDVGNLSTSGDLALSGNTLSTGTLSSGGDLSLDSVANLSVGDLNSSGDLSLTTAGNLTAGNLYAADRLAVIADGDLQAFNLIAGGGITADAGGNLSVGNVESGFVPAESPPPGGPIGPAAVATGVDVLLTAGGNVSTGVIDSAGNLSMNAGGAITTGDLTAALDLNLASVGDFSAGNLNAGGSVALSADGDIDALDVLAGGSISADAGGSLTLEKVETGAGPQQAGTVTAAAAGNDVVLTSDGDLNTGSIRSGGSIVLDAGGTLATGALEATADIAGNAVGNINVGGAFAGGALTLDSGGSIVAGDLEAGGAVDLAAAQNLEAGAIAANAVTMHAIGSLTAGNIDASTLVTISAATFSLHDVFAGTSINLTAGGLADFLGMVSAPVINVSSGDINVALGASLGEAGVTEVLNLLAISDEPVLLGDAGSPTATSYVLDEEGEIVATTVNFTAKSASGGSDPDIRVGNFEIEGSQTAGGGVAHVNLATGGDVIVEGVIDYYNAAATDTFTITAGDTIQVITDTGGIGMTDNAGLLSGTLTLNADDVWVGDQALLNQLNADPNFAGRDAALATNNGPANPDGYVRAGGVEANVAETFFVQNSGTADNEGGITVGNGGLSVTNTGSSPATAVAYGRQSKSDGTVVTGDAFVQQVEFAGSGGFSSGSSVNGCPTSGCVAPPPPPPPPPPAPPPPPPPSPPPPTVTPGVESILGPIGMMNSPTSVAAVSEATGGVTDQSESSEESEESEEESKDNAGAIDASIGLINSGPVSLELTIDDPVTSGSDGPGL